ncbi:Unknown protein [Striga hermonthica]|uniref:F-box domain-containing protein n=1 Tax=Striga hermonthica TaxID=68872 RepID=A0A9N7MK52_STRHE|nr:Unknown protein [Striga hermonthica]
MAKFPSSIFRLPPPSSPPSSGEASEAEGIADGKKLCAQNILLISLPDDLLLKILLNLSAQDIYYAASRVCRRLYYRTIRSEEFINLHLRQQTEDYGLLFGFTNNDQHYSQRTVFVSMKQGRVTVSDFYYASKSRFIFNSSCNGLIPEFDFWKPHSGVYLANPVTGQALGLPPLPKNAKFMCCCLGYAEASKAYKVALVYSDIDSGRAMRWAILTVGVDSWWRHLPTHHYSTGSTLSQLLVTEGFIHFISGDIVRTLNVETEVMTETLAPFPVYPPNGWYLSTGKSLTLVVNVEDGVFRVWEMVSGDNCYYWRKWQHQIVLGSEIQDNKDLIGTWPVGWLQQMEVLVFKVRSKNWASLVCRRLYYHTIRSEEFVNLHLRQQNDEYGLLFKFINVDQHSSQRKVFVSMKQGRVTISDYYCTYISRFNSGSCNGLIPEYNCREPSSGILVVNPVTGRAFRLPPLPANADYMHCCVGYAEASKAYKVVVAYSDGGIKPHVRRAILTVGVDKSWRHLATDHLTMCNLIGEPLVTEGFTHSIFGDAVLTLNVEIEVMTKTLTPVPDPPQMCWWFLSTGKSLTALVEVDDCGFRVWEMLSGDYDYYWREWERQIVVGSQRIREIRELCGDKDLIYISPIGWLQHMEVLVFEGWSKNKVVYVFYMVIATGEIGWIAPVSSSEEKGESYTSIGPFLPHKNTLVQLEGYY